MISLLTQQCLQIDSIHVQAAGLIDIDKTFYIQLTIFVLLMVLMKVLVYNPFLTLEEARYNATDGAKKEAKDLHAKAEDLENTFNEGIKNAQSRGSDDRNSLKSEGEKAMAIEINKLRAELDAQLKESITELNQHEEQARNALGTETERLAQDVATRIMEAS